MLRLIPPVSVPPLLSACDQDMPQAAKNAFASFFMRSLQAWAMVVKEPGIDMYYIIDGFRAFSGTLYAISFRSMHRTSCLEFDLLLDQTAAFSS